MDLKIKSNLIIPLLKTHQWLLNILRIKGRHLSMTYRVTYGLVSAYFKSTAVSSPNVHCVIVTLSLEKFNKPIKVILHVGYFAVIVESPWNFFQTSISMI
jgi:hypothetical protein